jgi:nucleotide-binding universal stress UspA family protein
MRFLVAYNGSKASKSALDLAKEHAKIFDAQILVMSSSVGGSGEKPDAIKKIQIDLERIQDDMEAAGLHCEIVQLARGLTPGEDLVRFAEENSIDQMFVGIQNKSRTRKLLMGSTAQYVILKSNCPVISVK